MIPNNLSEAERIIQAKYAFGVKADDIWIRLVAKRYRQNIDETVYAVPWILQNNWNINEMDVPIVLFNGNPEGMNEENTVSKLRNHWMG